MTTSLDTLLRPTPTEPCGFVPPRRQGPDGQVRTPDRLAVELQRRLHAFRAIEATSAAEVRLAAEAILDGVGSRLAALQERAALTRRPLDWRFLGELEHCSRELDLIAPLWDDDRSSPPRR